MPYALPDDVIAVQRGPEPGGLGGAYRTFGATLQAACAPRSRARSPRSP